MGKARPRAPYSFPLFPLLTSPLFRKEARGGGGGGRPSGLYFPYEYDPKREFILMHAEKVQ